MELTTLIVPTLTNMLGRLSDWLTKAQQQMPGEAGEALLSARLAPDMFPLATQVRFACVQAYEAMHRLKGEEFPAIVTELLDEGRNAGEAPGSIADAQARIAETLAMIEGFDTSGFDAEPQRMVAHQIPAGIIIDLTAEQYARDWALQQFNFHIMIAYAILRAQGVDLGKADYVAHLFPFIRPGTMPTA